MVCTARKQPPSITTEGLPSASPNARQRCWLRSCQTPAGGHPRGPPRLSTARPTPLYAICVTARFPRSQKHLGVPTFSKRNLPVSFELGVRGNQVVKNDGFFRHHSLSQELFKLVAGNDFNFFAVAVGDLHAVEQLQASNQFDFFKHMYRFVN